MVYDMKKYGLTERFLNLAREYNGLTIARVVSQEKGMYRIMCEQGEISAVISGKLRFNAKSASDLPAVGDFVMAEVGTSAIIHYLLTRKSCVVRKAAGDKRTEQIVAANVGTLFICMSLNRDYNLRRLERYLAIGWDSGAVPVIVLTKTDLTDDLEQRRAEIEKIAPGVEILFTSALEKGSSRQLMSYVTQGKTAAFIGSSGVGKSTLINRLIGKEYLVTNEIRNDDKGRHTTTHRELILIPGGGAVIDTPGMRELGMWEPGNGVEYAFSEIDALAAQCKFKNCTHTNEAGCAVREALDNGELTEERFRSYRKLKAEMKYAADNAGYLAGKERKFKEIAKQNKWRKGKKI